MSRKNLYFYLEKPKNKQESIKLLSQKLDELSISYTDYYKTIEEEYAIAQFHIDSQLSKEKIKNKIENNIEADIYFKIVNLKLY